MPRLPLPIRLTGTQMRLWFYLLMLAPNAEDALNSEYIEQPLPSSKIGRPTPEGDQST